MFLIVELIWHEMCELIYALLFHLFVTECPSSESECPVVCPDANCRYCQNETGHCTGCKPGFYGNQCKGIWILILAIRIENIMKAENSPV